MPNFSPALCGELVAWFGGQITDQIPPMNRAAQNEVFGYLRFAALASRARRAAVRFRAAASDAFRARADRSSGVMFFAAVLPPCLPNCCAISFIAARTAGGIL